MSDELQGSAASLLVVDDDAGIRELLRKYFAGNGFRILEAGDVPEARRRLAEERVDLVLLDLGLPGEDGLSFARSLREHWQGAVIIMTGRNDAVDRIIGLEIGADDYVGKPFDLRELLARVRTVLRRAQAPATARAATQERRYRFGPWRLDTARRELLHESAGPVALTTGEYELLLVLVEAGGRVCSRDVLTDRLHRRESTPFDRAIDVQVGRLRRKLAAGAEREFIRSIRGVGYALAEAVERT